MINFSFFVYYAGTSLYNDLKMGNEASLHMEMATNFDAEEIKRLGKRFKKLDIDNSGSLSVDEFMTLPELQQNPLVQRVIDIFDEVSKSSTRRLFQKARPFLDTYM